MDSSVVSQVSGNSVLEKLNNNVLDQLAHPILCKNFFKGYVHLSDEDLECVEVEVKYRPEGTCNDIQEPIKPLQTMDENSVLAKLNKIEVLDKFAEEVRCFFLKYLSEEELSFVEVELKYLPKDDDDFTEIVLLARLICYDGEGEGCGANRHWGLS